MKEKTLLKKLKLTDEDFENIRQKVAEAEKKTTGEIALAVTAESGSYSFQELLASCIFAAAIFIFLLPFSDKFTSLFQHIYWNNAPVWLLPAFYFAVTLLNIAIGFYLTNIPLIDRLIIPRRVKSKTVSERAVRYFAESGVYETAEHSGILIFVSYLEHQVRIIADSGISTKISQDLWNLIADELCENLHNGNSALAFETAVTKCGELLAENFPPHSENPNELPDGLVIISNQECL